MTPPAPAYALRSAHRTGAGGQPRIDGVLRGSHTSASRKYASVHSSPLGLFANLYAPNRSARRSCPSLTRLSAGAITCVGIALSRCFTSTYRTGGSRTQGYSKMSAAMEYCCLPSSMIGTNGILKSGTGANSVMRVITPSCYSARCNIESNASRGQSLEKLEQQATTAGRRQ
jgi:hypothetical protein